MNDSFHSALLNLLRRALVCLLALAMLIGAGAVATNTVIASPSSIELGQSTPSDSDDGTTTIFLPVVISNQSNGSTDEPSPVGSSPVGEAALQETSLDIRINTASDDVEERLDVGLVNMSSSDLELGNDLDGNFAQIIGLRFKNLAIPQGATIVNAYLEFEADETGSGNASVIITGQAADNAAAFSAAAYDVSSRPTTAASIIWSLSDWYTVNATYQSPNLATIVQEIVNRNGWSNGNNLVLFLDGVGTRTAESYEGEAPAAPLLHIEFTTQTSSPTPAPTPAPISTPTPTSSQPTPTSPPTPTPEATDTGTLNVRVNASGDDVEERLTDGFVYINSTDLELGNDPGGNGDQIVGLRFTNLAIPQGATIVNAYLEFEADETGTGSASIIITGQAVDNATAFSTVAYDVSSRPTTAASSIWSLSDWYTVNATYQSPNLATIVQEIVNRNGWSNGNNLVLFLDGIGKRTAESYDGEAPAAPLLHIEFTTQTSSPTATPSPMSTPAQTPTPGATATWTPTPTPSSTGTPSVAAIRFAVVGDFGDDSTDEGNVAAMITGQNPDFIIAGGDNRYDPAGYDRAVGYYYCDYLAAVAHGPSCAGGNRTTNAFFPVPGNHDYGDGGGIDEYLNYFTLPGSGIATTNTSGNERYYDIIWGPVHFFFLDSDAAVQDLTDRAAQQSWLFTQMTASTAPWQVVIVHHPPYSSSFHGSSNAMKWPYLEWGADAVIAAHDHTYERLSQDGLVYFVNGLGGRSIYEFNTPIAGSQVRYDGDYGAMLVDADANGIQFRFLTQTGIEIDRYTVGTPLATGTVDLRLTQSNDDVEETVATGSINGGSYDLELVYDGADQMIGLRFNGVQIPQGATIQQAYLEFEADETQSEATDLTIRAEAADHAPAFNFSLFDVSSRPRTNATTSWQAAPWTTVDAKYQTPDISAIVAEIVNRPGWQSGNSMVFVISGSGHRTAEAVDGEPAAAPRLYVEYR